MVKKTIFLLFCFVLTLNLSPVLTQWAYYHGGEPIRSTGYLRFVPNQIIVKLKAQEWGKRLASEILQTGYPSEIMGIGLHSQTGYYICQLHPSCDPERLLLDLRQNLLVEEASLNYMARLASEPPNDAFFIFQYALYNYGQVYFPTDDRVGISGSDIKALDGWDWSTGDREIVIAVIDSGVALYHEDLITKVVPGYNFIEDSFDAYDDNGHGTLVASIAAAETNNSIGVAGVCWQSMIMPIKCFDSLGDGSYLAIAGGIRFAADRGALVINMSFGGESDSFILEDACQYAFSKGCVLIAATGNDGGQVLYPAQYDDYCVAVGASNASDQLADFSNFGSQVDVVAPGVDVFGALFSPDEPDNLRLYGWGSGTSFAAPHVSGAVALLLSYKPNLSNIQVMSLIKYTADDVNDRIYPGIDVYMGYGRINLKTFLGPFPLN
ncbi:MAG: peptidase S8 [Candidatus Aminicenantes bacterium]|nr:peptidase S8 [Candidatus Aminicenantes bacterium]